MRMAKFAGLVCLGGFIGAVVVSVLVHLYWFIRYPDALGDGQYGMIFMLTTPVGWLIGSVIAATIAWHMGAPERGAGLVTGLLIVGGVVAGPIMGIFGLFALNYFLYLFRRRG